MNDNVKSVSLETAINMYLLDKKANCKKETIAVYRERLGYFVKYLCNERKCEPADILMISISLSDLKAYNLYLSEKNAFDDHPFIGKKKAAISNTSRHGYTNDLKIFLRWAYAEELITFDLSSKYKLVKLDKKQILPLYQDEIDKIDCCFNLKTETGLRDWCLVHVMLDCGLRRSEVIKLRVQDVNFDKDYIHIVLGKESKSRFVWLPGKLKSNMFKYHNLYAKGSAGEEPFFTTVRGHAELTPDTIGNFFSRLKKRSGVNKLHPHLLRHTFASAFILGGGDLRTLQNLMGHSSVSVTEKYVHICDTYKYLSDDVYKLDKTMIRRYY